MAKQRNFNFSLDFCFRYLATSLPRYLTTSLPHYLATSLPHYLATSLPRYLTTSLPRYLATSLLAAFFVTLPFGSTSHGFIKSEIP